MSDNTTDIMRFELPTEHNSIIKVIGVGGGGSGWRRWWLVMVGVVVVG